jgi:hypothetical protein
MKTELEMRTRLGATLTLVVILLSVLLPGSAPPPNARTDLLAFLESPMAHRRNAMLKGIS